MQLTTRQTTNPNAPKLPFGSLFSSMLGIILLLPASYFIGTILLRICFGSRSLYYSMAPSFLQSPFNLFAFHRAPEASWPKANHKMFAVSVLHSLEHDLRQNAAQFILGCLFLSVCCNVLSILKFNLQPGKWGWQVQVSYRRYWLNTAIALQSALLLLVLIAYALIQHIRY